LLHQKNKISSLRYKLKQALLDLGPTGFPFECFISEIFRKLGFQTKTGIIVEGNCVTHEMDVIASRDSEQHFVECKYGNTQGKYVSVQVPLYVRSRVNDIIEKRKKISSYQDRKFFGWVVTNTRFSPDSITYGKCCGLHLLSWDYPYGKSLKEIIEQEKIFPITILHHLDRKEKEILMEQGIVVCSQLLEHPEAIKMLDLSEKEHLDLQEELSEVCNLSPLINA
jgi:hypothetical protein